MIYALVTSAVALVWMGGVALVIVGALQLMRWHDCLYVRRRAVQLDSSAGLDDDCPTIGGTRPGRAQPGDQ